MPRPRADLDAVVPYRPGRPIEEVAADYGLDEVHKLASNECPLPPFPEVQAAVTAAVGDANRYPDNDKRLLRAALAEHLDVPPERLWIGGGSNELILVTAITFGGPGTSAVYAWPSFGLYRIASRVAMSDAIEVPLDVHHRHDLAAMAAAVRADTSIVYVCNPNNPTGTHVGGADLFGFIDGLPSDVLVVVDEAYVEYATAPDYASALPLAMERDNVVVARTFSKAYGLAGLRVGYLVGSPEVFDWTRKVQLPFTVSTVAQAAAREALRHSDRLAERIHLNAAGLKLFTEELTARGIGHADSQTNFVYLRHGGDAEAFQERMLRQGVIVRPQADGWSRVSIGTEAENRAFFRALDVLEDETA